MILDRASRASGLPIAEIVGRRRTPDVCLVRWAIMSVLRERGLSIPSIGRLLHRDHSTVCSGLKRADQLRGRPGFEIIRSVIA